MLKPDIYHVSSIEHSHSRRLAYAEKAGRMQTNTGGHLVHAQCCLDSSAPGRAELLTFYDTRCAIKMLAQLI